ncbi:hypothetical protein Droror1_Dr00026509 [Drosera rotundifolia]
MVTQPKPLPQTGPEAHQAQVLFFPSSPLLPKTCPAGFVLWFLFVCLGISCSVVLCSLQMLELGVATSYGFVVMVLVRAQLRGLHRTLCGLGEYPAHLMNLDMFWAGGEKNGRKGFGPGVRLGRFVEGVWVGILLDDDKESTKEKIRKLRIPFSKDELIVILNEADIWFEIKGFGFVSSMARWAVFYLLAFSTTSSNKEGDALYVLRRTVRDPRNVLQSFANGELLSFVRN